MHLDFFRLFLSLLSFPRLGVLVIHQNDNVEPLWSETQQVKIGSDGRYSVLLGGSSDAGLSQSVFEAGEARWVGVRIERGEEQPRTLLTSVPYARKAADAETIDGISLTNLVTKEQLANTAKSLAAQAVAAALPEATLSGAGTADTLAMWTGSTALGNSIVYQSGTTRIGVATKTPGAVLDVNSTALVRGTLDLPAIGTATAALEANSPMFEMNASAFNKRLNAAQTTTFAWRAIVAGNDTLDPAVSLDFLAATGATAPQGTGLSISPAGIFTFAPGQTFPGAGSITGVTAGNGLTGGGTSGNALSLDASKLPLLPGSNIFTGSETFTGTVSITGDNIAPLDVTTTKLSAAAIVGQSSNGGAGVEGIGQNGGTGVVASGDYAGVSVVGNTFGVYSIARTGNGVYGSTPATGGPAGVYGNSSTNYVGSDGFGGIGVSGNASGPSSFGVYGNSTGSLGFGVFGNSPKGTGGYGVYGTGDVGVYGSTPTAKGYGVYGNSVTGQGGWGVWGQGDTGVYGSSGSSKGTGVYGISAINQNGYGVYGQGDTAVYGNSLSTTGTGIIGNGSFGVYGASNYSGSAFSPTGVYGFVSKSNTSTQTQVGVGGEADGDNAIGVSGNAPGGEGVGVWGTGGQTGVYATAASQTAYGVHSVVGGQTASVFTLFNQTDNQTEDYGASIWADTSEGTLSHTAAAMVATAGDNNAGIMFNDSASSETLRLHNDGSAGSLQDAVRVRGRDKGAAAPVLRAGGARGDCGVNSDGDVYCTGRHTTAVSLTDGSRQVEVYSVQSTENWFDDVGSRKLDHGRTTVSIESTFAQIVDTGVEYHVFLTPSGECRGLYVASKTARGFEVRELGGGTSNVAFDYRIVAKRSDYETQRLADATAEVGNLSSKRRLYRPGGKSASPGGSRTGVADREVSNVKQPVFRSLPPAPEPKGESPRLPVRVPVSTYSPGDTVRDSVKH